MEEKMKTRVQRFLSWHSNTYNSGFLGRLKITAFWFVVSIVAMVVIGGVGAGGSSDRVEVEGDRATIHNMVYPHETLDHVTRGVLGDVADLARSNRSLKEIRVVLTMSGSSLVDEYGNRTPEDIPMGELTWDSEELDEVRKYTEDAVYRWKEMHRLLYMQVIREMRGAYLLER